MTTEEYEEFYALCVRRLIGQVYLLTGSLHEAEDVVQDAFVRCWTRRRSIKADAAPEAWVRTVAFRLAISRFRRVRRGRDAWQRAMVGRPAEVAAPDEQTVMLAQALGRLPERQRLVMVMFYLCDMTVEQVASEAGMSTGTVKTHLSRGRTALNGLLQDVEGGPSGA
ncbi:SigE family RNA polymerase sigma factor [Streptomyces sp. Caat 7-52]|uniref:SigE family RNA polymerase sigma factor n=1 Tax=Streptomyces sp. Caat 7-52 TaxID=2949637 RepID=UPI0020355EBA|nr:SigE family RNA polymerase sigma factor [Streptomyces sp. Caat 7-52]